MKLFIQYLINIFLIILFSQNLNAVEVFKSDILTTTSGDLEMTFIGHGSLLLKFDKKYIYVDPYSRLADFSKLPKADFIFITHNHPDHLDKKAIDAINTIQTQILLDKSSFNSLKTGTTISNGEEKSFAYFKVLAVPAYNLLHKNPMGEFFHPKGIGNGYVFTFGNKRIYIAGDTENIPEMKNLKNIDVAFLPMNLPYTMTPEMVAEATKMIKPKILYPYHFGDTDTALLPPLLKDLKETEIRLRDMK